MANQRVHGTTHKEVRGRWEGERTSLQPMRAAYPYLDEELRKVARDAYVSWQGSRYLIWVRVGVVSQERRGVVRPQAEEFCQE